MMPRFRSARVVTVLLGGYLGVAFIHAAEAQVTGTASTRQSSPAGTSTVVPSKTFNGRAVLDRYCTGCHNTRLKTAGLLLDQADVDHPGSNPELWEKVVRKLRSGAMPPAGLPRPDKGAYDSFASYLESTLDQEWIAHPNPGYPAAVHRLNRIEYVNAIRDLLALELEASGLLPP